MDRMSNSMRLKCLTQKNILFIYAGNIVIFCHGLVMDKVRVGPHGLSYTVMLSTFNLPTTMSPEYMGE